MIMSGLVDMRRIGNATPVFPARRSALAQPVAEGRVRGLRGEPQGLSVQAVGTQLNEDVLRTCRACVNHI